MPVPSTWIALSSLQEVTQTRLWTEFPSTARLAGWEISPNCSMRGGYMAAATTTMMTALKWDIDINYYNSRLIIFQTLLVTGGKGRRSGNFLPSLSSTELLKETASAWAFTSPLPSPRGSLKGANIDNKILMTGNWSLSIKRDQHMCEA